MLNANVFSFFIIAKKRDFRWRGDFGAKYILIKKTYQFINVVTGVSHSHKTANILFSFNSVA